MPTRRQHLARVPLDLEQHITPIIEIAGDTRGNYSRRVLLAAAERRWNPHLTDELADYLNQPQASTKAKVKVWLSVEERTQLDEALAALNSRSGTTWKLSSTLTAGLFLLWKEWQEAWERLPVPF